jgi:hypothetical protein
VERFDQRDRINQPQQQRDHQPDDDDVDDKVNERDQHKTLLSESETMTFHVIHHRTGERFARFDPAHFGQALAAALDLAWLVGEQFSVRAAGDESQVLFTAPPTGEQTP